MTRLTVSLRVYMAKGEIILNKIRLLCLPAASRHREPVTGDAMRC